jgi:hypothetical protein
MTSALQEVEPPLCAWLCVSMERCLCTEDTGNKSQSQAQNVHQWETLKAVEFRSH